uniref:Uncharacterized protein n=1 Tax=Rhizophora mucronata TaxID=61149 RepID=A0A2P2JGU5_RHIMU
MRYTFSFLCLGASFFKLRKKHSNFYIYFHM